MVVNRHASASRASYLQRLGPSGFEELLAKIELTHRQVTSHFRLSVMGRGVMAPRLEVLHPGRSHADACSSTSCTKLSL